ncbi:MAG: efflux RND transporter permease subunit [Verrucomicrobiota bacterium JB022]|nr:efflux RND transporter permease subunit [Verrucomicrobiota bacterium JB022]
MAEQDNDQAKKDPMAGQKGIVAWFISHPVAANLIMLLFLAGGLLTAFRAQQEVFPQVELDQVTISVPYPGAGPEEVEEAIILPIEDAVRGVDGVKEVRASASEGSGTVLAELITGTDRQRALNDIKNEVAAIRSFPAQAEEPIITIPDNRTQVISLIFHGEATPQELKMLAEEVRQDLLHQTPITYTELDGLPEPEISIEIPQANLRRYGLSVQDVAQAVDAASIELPAGALETPSGDLRLRVTEEREYGIEFRDVAVIREPNGSVVTLADLGAVVDGFRDEDIAAYFNGERAVRLKIYRVGDQTPLEITGSVRSYLERKRLELPKNLSITTWNDSSEIFRDRIGLLIENGRLGVILVLIILGLFLRPRLAFWVTLGLPISLLGAFIFMPVFDVSINMLSLFAFLLVLGIVVDDAIVVGEAISDRRSQEDNPRLAALLGTKEVLVPVVFAVMTTIVAFSPLLFVPGVAGEFFSEIPLIIIPILLISLVESLLVLPSHLAEHAGDPNKKPEGKGIFARLSRAQNRFSEGFRSWVDAHYPPVIERVLRWRYLTLAAAYGVLIIVIGFVASGYLPTTFIPNISGDRVSVALTMPYGTSQEQTERAMRQIVNGGRAALDEARQQQGDDQQGDIAEGIFAMVGSQATSTAGPGNFGGTPGGSHLAAVEVSLVPGADRAISTRDFADLLREKIGEIPGAETFRVSYDTGPATGSAVSIQLVHSDLRTLEAASAELAERLRRYNGVRDVDDGFQEGKEQIDLTLRPSARARGLTEADLAQQLRGLIFGAEVERQQRGRDELRVYVRLPDDERNTSYLVDNLILRTPQGGEIPLPEAAYFERGHSATTINRQDGRRVAEVTADVDEQVTTGGEITAQVLAAELPELKQRYPGLEQFVSGEQEDQQESMASLQTGMLIALLVMYGLMAVVFNSYLQPFIIMLVVPFGLVGAVIGHLLLGYNLSIISMFGLVALSGVVVNDSLVLVAAVNDRRREGMDLHKALVDAGRRRFRPVVLTSLTTFMGLAPMIFETQVQARFIIPMAISLGFGVLFVTVITLLLVPATYLAAEDARHRVSALVHRARGKEPPPHPSVQGAAPR